MTATSSDTVATVMLVDDEPLNILLLEECLASENYRLLSAESAEEMFSLLKHETPDVILLDVMMPNMNGFQACRVIRKEESLKNIPIIFVTALNQVDDYVRAIESGANDFMTKPFNQTILKTRIKAYLHAKQLSDEVERIQQLKSDLTAMIVHDLNGPMFGLVGYLDMLCEEKDVPEKIYSKLLIAKASAQDASRMIGNILTIDKIQSGQMVLEKVPANIHDLVTRNLELMTPQVMAASRSVEISGDKNLQAVIDSDLFGRLIQNLLSNAIKFSLKTEPIRIYWKDTGQALCFSVENKGLCISEEDSERIFERFVQVISSNKSRNWGVGLGLSFCKMVAIAHQGEITAVSPLEGKQDGVCFQVLIPHQNQ